MGNIIRVSKPEKYAVVSQEMLRDSRLSFAARGLLSYLLSKPNDWEMRTEDLIAQSPAGRDAVYAILKELESHGYLIREKVRGEGGHLHWQTTIFESPELAPKQEKTDSVKPQQKPNTDYPDTVKPNPVSPNTEKPHSKELSSNEVPKEENKNLPRTKRGGVVLANREGLSLREFISRLLTFRQQDMNVKKLPAQGKEVAAAKYLFDEEWSLKQVRDCYHDLKKQKWRGTSVDLTTVRSQIADWSKGTLNIEGNGNGQVKFGRPEVTRNFEKYPARTG